MSDMPELEGGESAPVEEAPVDAAQPEQPAEMPLAEAPIVENKPKRRVSIYWKRPKSHLYEYNYDYCSNYYKGMVDYLDRKGSGVQPALPKAMSWAERSMLTYTEKREAKSRGFDPDAELLTKIRSSVDTYTTHARAYARKITSTMTYQ